MLSNAPVQTGHRLPRDRTEYRMLVAALDFWPNMFLSKHWQIASFLYNEISRRNLNPYSWQDLSSIYNQCMLVSWCLTNVAIWNSFLVLHLVLKRIKEMFCKIIKTGQPHCLADFWTYIDAYINISAGPSLTPGRPFLLKLARPLWSVN